MLNEAIDLDAMGKEIATSLNGLNLGAAKRILHFASTWLDNMATVVAKPSALPESQPLLTLESL